MLVRVPDRKLVKIANLKKFAYERQGWCKVTEGRVGVKQYTCSCSNPCGYRAFPGAKRIRDIMWSDIMKLWRRALKATGVVANGPDSIENWETTIRELKHGNRRMRDAGLITKSSPIMLLAKLPGPVIRGLGHDFPQEFSPTVGARSEDINKHLEGVLDSLYVNHEHGKPMGACVPMADKAVVLV